MAFKALIIEDDSLMASLLSEKLRKAGLEVSLALDGESALQELGKELPDIVLLDLILPGINGFDLLAKIKRDEKFRPIPVIILSNLGSEEDIQRGISLGAKDYLIKAHVLIDDVVKKINDILEKKA